MHVTLTTARNEAVHGASVPGPARGRNNRSGLLWTCYVEER